MAKTCQCRGSGLFPGLTEAEPGSGRTFASATAECLKCKKGLRLKLLRLEVFCAGIYQEARDATLAP